jgi:replicative DNA helicase
MIDLELEILSMTALNQHAFPSVMENAALIVKHADLYEVLYRMYDDGVTFTLPSIHARIVEASGLDAANAAISKIAKSTGLTANIHDYIRQLQRQRRAERVRDMARSIISGRLTLEEIEAMILSETDRMAENTPDDGELLTDYATRPLDEIFPVGAAYKTGIAELDEKLYGIKRGQLAIIAARPSKGKTALLLQSVENMAKYGDGDGTILLFSMDATKDELYSRLLARRARVESWKIEYNKMNDEERERVIRAHDYYKQSGLKIKIYDTVGEINAIKANIRKHKNIKAVVIDFLQLISGDKSGSREMEVAGISRTCKTLAMTLRVPFILLSQLNRAIEFHNREPILSDLRESGAIEQDANIVIFIHSGEEEKQKEIEDSNFYVAKNKNGRTGKISTNFNKPFYEFGRIISDDSMDWTQK